MSDQMLPVEDEDRLDRMIAEYGPDSVLESFVHICNTRASECRSNAKPAEGQLARAAAWDDLAYQAQLVVHRKAGKL